MHLRYLIGKYGTISDGTRTVDQDHLGSENRPTEATVSRLLVTGSDPAAIPPLWMLEDSAIDHH